MKERITVSIDSKAIKLLDSVVGRENITNRSHAMEAIIMRHFATSGKIKAIIIAGKKPNQESIKATLLHLEKIGVEEIIIAGGKNNENIFSLINSNRKYANKASFLKEDTEMGTAGIIKSAETQLPGTFIVIYSDITYSLDLSEMLSAHTSSKKLATIAVTIAKNKTDMVDSIRVSGNTVNSFEYNSKNPTKIQNAGILIFESSALDYFPTKGSLEKDVLPKLAKDSNLGLFLFDSSWSHKS